MSRAALVTAYAEAAVYVHAAGLGVPEDEPSLREHFGIAPYEALLNGCAPVVYARGGPAQQVGGLEHAWLFADEIGLRAALVAAMRSFDAGVIDHAAIIARAAALQDGNAATLAALKQG